MVTKDQLDAAFARYKEAQAEFNTVALEYGKTLCPFKVGDQIPNASGRKGKLFEVRNIEVRTHNLSGDVSWRVTGLIVSKRRKVSWTPAYFDMSDWQKFKQSEENE